MTPAQRDWKYITQTRSVVVRYLQMYATPGNGRVAAAVCSGENLRTNKHR